LLQKICYEEKWWNICADLKVTTMLIGLHGCMPLQNYKMAFCSETMQGQKNMAHPALGDKAKIYLPP